VEFKSYFDGSKSPWLDALKHCLAIANSGGGMLIFGVGNGNQLTQLASCVYQLAK
jgi:predicted HTH transcriptional regulator